ncbi:hypothetical protein L4X63_21785 [Geomonas sp. Red32]|uniref:hypothetical protein n=1 Tax=Geomonas sp. Red32 TaxID=2912856 RepID=UPI00202CDAF7|nr:hypothetical protein [Geomonas sp. Red32]MCM0084218.1 hypothetical protein [Geomonas sp. Red32]
MKLLTILIITFLMAASSFAADIASSKISKPAPTRLNIKFTSLSDDHCKKSQELIDITGEEYAAECAAAGKWRLFKIYDSEGRSWIDISKDRSLWSPMDIISYDPQYNFGYFPTVDGFQNVEWILNDQSTPNWVIIGVAGQNRRDNLPATRYLIVKLTETTVKICGLTDSIKQAEEFITSTPACSITVNTTKIPEILKNKSGR